MISTGSRESSNCNHLIERRRWGIAADEGGGSDEQDDHSKYSSTQARRREYADCPRLRGPGVTNDADNSQYEAYCSKQDTKRVGPTQEMGRYIRRHEWTNLLNMGMGRDNGWFYCIRALPLVSLRCRRCCVRWLWPLIDGIPLDVLVDGSPKRRVYQFDSLRNHLFACGLFQFVPD